MSFKVESNITAVIPKDESPLVSNSNQMSISFSLAVTDFRKLWWDLTRKTAGQRDTKLESIQLYIQLRLRALQGFF